MVLNLIFDLILVAILILGSSYGYNKGLFKIAFAPIRLIFCVTISLTYSSFIGCRLISPVIYNVLGNLITPILNYLIDPLSTAIAFALLFLVLKILFSFIISLINKITEKGILGGINKALGGIFSGTVAFVAVLCIVSLQEYFVLQNDFTKESYFSEFSGGPIYQFFNLISPIRMIYTS